ncbi:MULTISPECIES: hypothetical protein [unclassified Streptomyces]|uniref:hypothetical protein n=1 Tax=unclassified Streptomyces TaxID=2593676 RepID=UPI002E37C96B|nr:MULTISPECIES: hypothetical protein [unclassified Streptomyces]
MPRGRHRHSPPLHRLLPPSAIAGVSLVCAVGPWLFTEPGVLRMLAAGAAVTAVAGAVVMRSWDTAAGKRVADLTRARASDEWRHEERVAELETDLDESRELRAKLERTLRARRAELAGLRNEHAALLRRYATAETERASALEGRRLLEIESSAPVPELPAAGEPADSEGSVDAEGSAEPETAGTADPARTPEDVAVAGEETDAEVTADEEAGEEPVSEAAASAEAAEAFSPAGSSLFLRADAALSRITGGAAEAGADGDARDDHDDHAASPGADSTETPEATEADGDAHADADAESDTAVGTESEADAGTGPSAESDPEPDPDPEAESVPQDDEPGASAGAGPGDSRADGSAHDAPAAPLNPSDQQPARADATDAAPSADGSDEQAAGTGPSTASEAAGEHTRTDTAPSRIPAQTPAPSPVHAKASPAAEEAALPVKPAKPMRPSGHFTVPTAVAVVPTAPARRPSVEGGFDFFGTQQETSSDAMESVQNEDLADVVGQEALALHKAEAEAGFKPVDEGSRGVGQVIDLTAHDETEHIDVGVLRSAVS